MLGTFALSSGYYDADLRPRPRPYFGSFYEGKMAAIR